MHISGSCALEVTDRHGARHQLPVNSARYQTGLTCPAMIIDEWRDIVGGDEKGDFVLLNTVSGEKYDNPYEVLAAHRAALAMEFRKGIARARTLRHTHTHTPGVCAFVSRRSAQGKAWCRATAPASTETAVAPAASSSA